MSNLLILKINMEKDLEVLYLKKIIKDCIRELDRDKLHILYFSSSLNLHNFYKAPLSFIVKTYNLFSGKKQIDHIAHISRFVFDEEMSEYDPKIFEATLERGMEENDLFDKLKSLQGVCYIETIDIKVDKKLAREFEDKYTGVPYSTISAGLSGIKKQIKINTNGGFCSWLEALFIAKLGIDISSIRGGNPLKITPADIFNANLGNKRILYKF